MVQIRAIRSEEDYDAALARITELMDALSGSDGQIDDIDDPFRVELDVLTDLVGILRGTALSHRLPRRCFRHPVPNGPSEPDPPRPCSFLSGAGLRSRRFFRGNEL